jgi:hypothetical protein
VGAEQGWSLIHDQDLVGIEQKRLVPDQVAKPLSDQLQRQDLEGREVELELSVADLNLIAVSFEQVAEECP